MKFNFRVLILSLVIGLSLGGCGTTQPLNDEVVQGDVFDRNQPFSKGPSSPPNIKGPSSPPPQAVTTTDNLKVTLPN